MKNTQSYGIDDEIEARYLDRLKRDERIDADKSALRRRTCTGRALPRDGERV